MQEEENEVFAQARQVLDDDRATLLAAEYDARKAGET